MAEHIPELLAPAGSYEAAMAALCNGADAIYLGAAAFGARASAGFSQQELKQVIDLYHFYGRRVYVTVNTLVKQRELDGVRDTLRMLSDLRADAVLVQDWGLWQLARLVAPDQPLHASTQMSLPCMPQRKWQSATLRARVWPARWDFPAWCWRASARWTPSALWRIPGWKPRCSSMARSACASAVSAGTRG